MVWVYIFIPVLAAALGAALAAYRPPGPKLTSSIQHLAAGVVFAAAAGELLPAIKEENTALPVILGGGAGIFVMLFVRWLGEKATGPIALITMVGVDILIDGLVLGIGFASGGNAGLVLTVALTLEILFLGLAVAAAMSGGEAETDDGAGKARAYSPGAIIGVTTALALLLPIGAVIGLPAGGLPAPWLAGFFSFGLIALLYLVTEELLVEAHEDDADTPFATAMFFVGFLALILIEEALG